MSKRELKTYIASLKKRELEDQVLDLYERFKNVKEYYDFSFRPNEEALLTKAKAAILKEYFPPGKRKAKARRSIAQKTIRHYKLLGVDPWVIAEIMFYNIETAQAYAARKQPKQDAFYSSLFNSYDEAVTYMIQNGLKTDFLSRIEKINEEAWIQNWFNKTAFERVVSGVR